MPSASWSLTAISVPDGATVDLHAVDGQLAARPVPGAERLPGRYVLAGLVDAHVHLALDMSGTGLAPGSAELVAHNRRAHLDAGVLLARDVGAPVGLHVGGDHPDGPVVVAAGRFLAPAGRYLPGLYESTAPEELLATARHELTHSDGWVKVVFDFPEHFTGPESFPAATPNYDQDLLAQLCAEVHAAGGRVAAHVSGEGDSARAVAAGVDSLEHGIDVTEADLEALGRRGGAWTPTLTTVLGSLGDSPMAAALGERFGHLLGVARRVGVAVLAGTDGTPHGSVAEEVALMARLGFEPADALAAASVDARRYLGRPGLVPGALVDLVTYDDDPRTDPAVLARPVAVVRAGRRVR